MIHNIQDLVREIQYVLAPAVMVSSSALLLLSFNNKFSSLAGRFRILNDEKRRLAVKPRRETGEELRLKNLEAQLTNLMQRAQYVKQAIVLCYLSMAGFIGTSIMIFINVYSAFGLYQWVVGLFLVSLFLLLLSVFLMILETEIFYKIISLERKS